MPTLACLSTGALAAVEVLLVRRSLGEVGAEGGNHQLIGERKFFNHLFMAIVHHHLLFQARVKIEPGSLKEDDFRKFMENLLTALNMNCLMEPRFKLSHQNAWTGLMGIITSHIAFHYWIDEQYVQLDIYTCKKFDREKALKLIKEFWQADGGKALFINRELEKGFEIEKIDF